MVAQQRLPASIRSPSSTASTRSKRQGPVGRRRARFRWSSSSRSNSSGVRTGQPRAAAARGRSSRVSRAKARRTVASKSASLTTHRRPFRTCLAAEKLARSAALGHAPLQRRASIQRFWHARPGAAVGEDRRRAAPPARPRSRRRRSAVIAPETTGTWAKASPWRSASARISAAGGWSAASPSGRLHMIDRKPMRGDLGHVLAADLRRGAVVGRDGGDRHGRASGSDGAG